MVERRKLQIPESIERQLEEGRVNLIEMAKGERILPDWQERMEKGMTVTIAETVFYRRLGGNLAEQAAQQDALLYNQLHAIEELGKTAIAKAETLKFLKTLYREKRKSIQGPHKEHVYPHAHGPLARALYFISYNDKDDGWIPDASFETNSTTQIAHETIKNAIANLSR